MQALCGRAAFSGVRVQPRASPAVAPAPSRGSMVVVAAVPKKKVSKSKTAIRKNVWKAQAQATAQKALFLAKLALKEGSRDSSDKDMAIGTPAAETAENKEQQ